jgi:hypothetical protein
MPESEQTTPEPTDTIGPTYPTQAQARDYLASQGCPIAAGKFSQDFNKGLLKQSVILGKKVWTEDTLNKYAHRFLVRTVSTSAFQTDNHKERLVKEQADKIALENEYRRGQYLLKSEEEQRDARILAGIKQAVENFGPFIIQDLITISKEQGNLEAAAPQLMARYSDQAADLFHRFATAKAV